MAVFWPDSLLEDSWVFSGIGKRFVDNRQTPMRPFCKQLENSTRCEILRARKITVLGWNSKFIVKLGGRLDTPVRRSAHRNYVGGFWS
jgi:hypothetical protein